MIDILHPLHGLCVHHEWKMIWQSCQRQQARINESSEPHTKSQLWICKFYTFRIICDEISLRPQFRSIKSAKLIETIKVIIQIRKHVESYPSITTSSLARFERSFIAPLTVSISSLALVTSVARLVRNSGFLSLSRTTFSFLKVSRSAAINASWWATASFVFCCSVSEMARNFSLNCRRWSTNKLNELKPDDMIVFRRRSLPVPTGLWERSFVMEKEGFETYRIPCWPHRKFLPWAVRQLMCG